MTCAWELARQYWRDAQGIVSQRGGDLSDFAQVLNQMMIRDGIRYESDDFLEVVILCSNANCNTHLSIEESTGQITCGVPCKDKLVYQNLSELVKKMNDEVVAVSG